MQRTSPTALACVLSTLYCLCTGSVHAQAASGSNAGVTTVEVFANSAMNVPLVRSDAYLLKVYRIDGLAQIEEQLNQGLPQTETEAMAYVQSRMPDLKKQVQAQAINAANGITLAIHYKLDRIPAIVINRRSVVYGITDVQQALSLYQQSQATGDLKRQGTTP